MTSTFLSGTTQPRDREMLTDMENGLWLPEAGDEGWGKWAEVVQDANFQL